MSRVWKQFLKNLAWPTGIAAYAILVSFGAAYADTLFTLGAAFVIVLFIAFPMLAYLFRDMWLEAKRTVERENAEMMRTLKGNDDRSGLYEK
jgi:hypothetical protein